jgi:RNA polymerase sigma factor (sigma-70 family)
MQQPDYTYKENTDLLSADELSYHIKHCALNERESQKKIYSSFYGYAMAICDRYTQNSDDALEIMNDGFLKIYKEIHHFTPAYADVVNSFKGWLRKIMVYTAIDHYRKYHKQRFLTDNNHNGVIELSAAYETPLDKMSYEEIIRCIQKLSPGYRAVLNLFIVEGFSHEEIAQHLGISVGTSKSNLSKARIQLQKLLTGLDINQLTKNAI